SFSRPQSKRSPRLTSQRPFRDRTLRVDYDSRMGKTGRKIVGNWTSPRQSLYVRLHAKPGKKEEVADSLRSAVPSVNAEHATVVRLMAWRPHMALSRHSTSGGEGGIRGAWLRITAPCEPRQAPQHSASPIGHRADSR